MSVAYAKTIGEFISEYRDLQIKESTFYTIGELSDNKCKYLVLDENWINTYTARLDTFKVEKKLSTEDYLKYKYNPARLSKDLYDTTEFAWLILHANEMNSETEFNSRNIFIYKAGAIDFLNEILVVNDEIIASNETEIYNLKQEEFLNTI